MGFKLLKPGQHFPYIHLTQAPLCYKWQVHAQKLKKMLNADVFQIQHNLYNWTKFSSFGLISVCSDFQSDQVCFAEIILFCSCI